MSTAKPLPKRALGGTGIEVSVLGLGTVKIGRNQRVKYPSAFDLPDDKSLLDLLALTKDLGVNLLDTAPAYGTSEERLGKLLSDRKNWVICSKAGEEFEGGQSSFAFDSQSVRNSVERSLKRLRTDYLDIVLIHSDGNDLDILNDTDCVETLELLKQEGLIRSIGLSAKTVEGGLLALQRLDLAMVTYNSENIDEGRVIEYAAEHSKGILIKKALNSGHLSVAENGVQSALDFVLGKPGVSSAIVGTINSAHLRSNVEAASAIIVD